MKRLKIATILCLLIITLFSCKSTKTENTISSKSDLQTSTTENNSEPEKFNFFQLGKSKYLEGGVFSLFTPGVFGDLKQQSAAVMINPKDSKAGFGSPYLAAYYILFFDAKGRSDLRFAKEQYFTDFENKKLDREGKKTYKEYGNTDVQLYWGTIKGSTPNNAVGKVNFGYEFVERSPYFTISIFPLTNQRFVEGQGSAPETSMNLTFYFTKSQITKFLDLLTEDSVNQALADLHASQIGGEVEFSDEY